MTLPRVRVALPWLQAALAEATAIDAVPPLDALRWLGGRGRLIKRDTNWRAWLLEPVIGAPELTAAPAGPVLAARHGQPVGAGCWCVAQPVHLSAGLDHLRLAPLGAAAPTGDEVVALAGTISAHFGDGGPRVAGFFDGAWLLHFAEDVQCVTHPPDTVVGRDVHDSMPAGPHGARVRSLMNELQMLLHEHPVNQRRERARALPINALWLWGFGTQAPATVDASGWILRSDDPWLNALLEPSAAPSDQEIIGDTLIALSQPPMPDPASALASVDTGLLAWLASQVRAGRIGQLDLLTGDATLACDGLARWRFWRRPLAASRWLE